MPEGWISVVGWRTFQHYDPAKRQPPWIKAYTELLDNEEYLMLPLRQRAILHGIWLAYASSRSKLGANPARIGLRIGDASVRARDITALCDAGFLAIVASAELAEGYHAASPRARASDVETETDVEEEQGPMRASERELQDAHRSPAEEHAEDLDPEPELDAEPSLADGPMAEDIRRTLGHLRPRGATA